MLNRLMHGHGSSLFFLLLFAVGLSVSCKSISTKSQISGRALSAESELSGSSNPGLATSPGSALSVPVSASAVLVSPPINGTLLGSPPRWIYQPRSGFVGVDRFSYSLASISTMRSGSRALGTDPGVITVTVNVGAPNISPPELWMGPTHGGPQGMSSNTLGVVDDLTDFKRLFNHPEEWSESRSKTKVFKFYAAQLTRLLEEDRQNGRNFLGETLFPRLRAWGFKIAIEVAGATAARCGEARVSLLRDEKNLFRAIIDRGGTVDYLVMDSAMAVPFYPPWTQTDTCPTLYTLAMAAEDVVRYVGSVKGDFPGVKIGMTDPLPTRFNAGAPAGLRDAMNSQINPDFRAVYLAVTSALAASNLTLDFIQGDNPYEYSHAADPVDPSSTNPLDQATEGRTARGYGSWAQVKEVEDFVKGTLRIPFGLVYNAEASNTNAEAYYRYTLDMYSRYARAGGNPNQYVVQSWYRYPNFNVPENTSDQITLTRLLKEFANLAGVPARSMPVLPAVPSVTAPTGATIAPTGTAVAPTGTTSSPSSPSVDHSITGTIEPVTSNSIALTGWACARNSSSSIRIHLYLGGPVGVGSFGGEYVADAPSDGTVAAACQSNGTRYRFNLPTSNQIAALYGGQAIYIYGISTFGLNNILLENSGTYRVPAPAVPVDHSIRGVIGDIRTINGTPTLTGWACSLNSPSSIQVHVYLNGPVGTGIFGGVFTADKDSEPQVAAVCQSTGTKYRFEIPATPALISAYGGSRVYIHGISTFGLTNELLTNSGNFSIPLAPAAAPPPPPAPPPVAYCPVPPGFEVSGCGSGPYPVGTICNYVFQGSVSGTARCGEDLSWHNP